MKLTDRELMAIFKKPEADAEWITSANNEEWLQRVFYFADKNRRENAA